MSNYQAQFTGSEEIADRTRAFHFAKPEGFSFKAGQAIDLLLPGGSANDGQSLRHTFSIVSAPEENRLTVATRMRDSQFKLALGALPVGAPVGIEGPFGTLTLHNDRRRPAIFVAGGIGITPFVSILRQAARNFLAQSFFLIYSNRRPRDAAFLAELQGLEKQLANFQLVATMTQTAQSEATWPGRTGQIDASLLQQLAAELPAPIYYLAGPPAFVEAMQTLLNGTGIDDDDIRSEGFYGY